MNETVISVKNNISNLTLLQISTQDLEAIQSALRDKIKQAPMMFIGMQVVADISAFDSEESLSLSLEQLTHCLASEGLNLVAVMTAKQAHRQAAIEQGIGAIPIVTGAEKKSITKRTAPPVAQPEPVEAVEKQVESVPPEQEPRKTFESDAAPAIRAENQVITHPIRSGQRVYAKGDLTIIGAVSAGAEVIADGNIHVYGTLRGRAIAGAQGDESANIFCQRLEAELISIAGNYKPNEDIDDEYRQKNVQISLQGEKICFLTL